MDTSLLLKYYDFRVSSKALCVEYIVTNKSMRDSLRVCVKAIRELTDKLTRKSLLSLSRSLNSKSVILQLH